MTFWEILFFIFYISFASARSLPSSQNIYRFPNAEVLATQPEIANSGLPMRVVVNDGERKAVKYVFLESDKLPGDYRSSFEQVSIDLPRLPPGEWNEAHIHLKRQTGTYSISNTTLSSHLGITNSWETRRIDYLDFIRVETLQHDRLQVVTHPDFNSPVLIKIASFPWEIPSLEREVTMYQLLHGSGATPEFLGHVIEGGRAIGFITEYIEQAPPTSAKDMQGCLAALRKLHLKGIAHGDAHNGNCLIRKDGSSVLIDFELSLQTWSREEFERDLDIMGRCILGISVYS